MVKKCDLIYPKENEEVYKKYYTIFKYPLHDFQKWSVESTILGNHTLVCSPTGTGKSIAAEFAVHFFHSIGKKTIYCSPIKSLSNQKFSDFTQKYPHIKIGLITGDIKINSDADVIIMTTEILLNKLYQIKSNSQKVNSSISFEMNIETELGCVIFDEIHMINDKERGHVWENSIILLPPQIQIIGLSATLDNPEKFANWLELKGQKENTSTKIVYLTIKKDRIIPLTHYSFITTTSGIFKSIKDKAIHEEIKSVINKPFIIQNSKGEFNEAHYHRMNKIIQLCENNNSRAKRQHVLNEVTKHLVEKEMLPALCYVFSRKQLEICAKEVTTNLLEFDSKIPYTIDNECDQIIRKLPNYEEYKQLPEYNNLILLLRKGIAIHHSGMIPILKEIVEILFSRGFIKLLFCTESVAIGLNLPVKTSIFTDVNKHDGSNLRILFSHEYTQAAGRAGRLGYDTVGHVIHLNNLFRNINSVNYKQMLKGTPQTLVSKFKISYNLLLNLIDIKDQEFENFANCSMIKEDIDSELKEYNIIYTKIKDELIKFENIIYNLKTPQDIIEEYIILLETKQQVVNKKRKEVERKIQNIVDNYKFIENDKLIIQKLHEKEEECRNIQSKIDSTQNYINSNIKTVLKLLVEEGFIYSPLDQPLEKVEPNSKEDDEPNLIPLFLTEKGSISIQLREIHCLVFSNILQNKDFDKLSSTQIISILSCFTNISVNEDYKEFEPNTPDTSVQELIKKIQKQYDYYLEKENNFQINTGIDYTIHFDLLNYVVKWIECKNAEECKLFLQNLEIEKDIFLGEFVKALLKITNISSEIEKIAELTNNIDLLSKLKEIPSMILKYVVTNQSLYL